jgi:2-keto-4-pentenoate hydratase/2-oxohepta-3-ene-1,7-dioic acid hydratase in catechol pathway
VVISRGGHAIRPEDAFDHVLGFAVFNDLTVRDWQHLGSQWTPGKNFDGTGPLGPFVVTLDEAGRRNRQIVTRLNGRVVQQAWTDEMVHPVAELITFCSTFTTLEPGDVIATGTPSGTGFKQDPPRFLRPSDVIEVEIDGLGCIQNSVVQA